MNTNTIENVLIDVLVSAKDVGREILATGKVGAIKAYEFAQEQIPDILHEVIVYNRVELTASFLMYLILAGLCAYITKWFVHKTTTTNDFEGGELLAIFPAAGTVAFLVITARSISDVVKVWFAPKLFLIEYIANLAKTVN